ncbi:AbfB domain-containing protein [Corynebacterium anserum]|uniref:Uncharacterized protein n=1 Tax=Corynebacterium anserum TaxID=2684406 RepID=A0A7G7YQ97_9CORY|nr:AbfB domain-containing protein [Corynebacterium anserum]MBC2682345.1 hypothetical protein [Corynebacterium anserum]QNH96667.1 hypothetical protein GP473_08400 [Corynebacterium anserum]
MSVLSLLTRGALAAIVLTASINTASAAQADIPVKILAGDGGIVQEQCGKQPQQIRVDSSSVSTFSVCFALTKPTGWAAMNLTGSYGVVNNLTVDVNVAFKLPDGAVYWQDAVHPGQAKSIDVNNAGSTIVELQVIPVATNNGASSATLIPGTDDAPNYVSLRSASAAASGRTVRVTWAGVTTTPLSRNSSFLDRLDGSFLVAKGLSDPACVSLESAAYPGMYLQATSPTDFSLSSTPSASHATWCPNPATTPVTSTRLVWATDRTKALAITSQGSLVLGAVDSADSRWFTDQALARP